MIKDMTNEQKLLKNLVDEAEASAAKALKQLARAVASQDRTAISEAYDELMMFDEQHASLAAAYGIIYEE